VLVKIIAILALSLSLSLHSSIKLASLRAKRLPGILTGVPSFSSRTSASTPSLPPRGMQSPQRDLPRGIIATLVVCTLLYIAVVVVLTVSFDGIPSSTTPPPSLTP